MMKVRLGKVALMTNSRNDIEEIKELRYSVPAAKALVPIVTKLYELGTTHCRFLHHGFNCSYELDTGRGNYVLRLYRNGLRSEDNVKGELKLLSYLADKGLPVSAPIANENGDYYFTVQAPEGLRYGAIFKEAPGGPLHSFDEEEMASLGHLLGRFHRLCDDWSEKIVRETLDGPSLVAEPLSHLEDAFPHKIQRIRELGFELTAVRSIDATVIKQAPVFGLVHGGFLCQNLYRDGDSFTLIDFDFCAYGYRLYDLGTFKWSLMKHEGVEAKELFSHFLKQYTKVFPIQSQLLRLIDDFVAVRELWNWATKVRWGDDIRRLSDYDFEKHCVQLEKLLLT